MIRLIQLNVHHFLWRILCLNIDVDNLLRWVRLLHIDIHFTLWQVLLLQINIKDFMWCIGLFNINVKRPWRWLGMLDIDIDHLLRRFLCLHFQLHLVVVLDGLLFDLKVNAVGGIGWILLNININLMLDLLALLLNIKANLVLWLLELVLLHLDVYDWIRLLSGLFLLDIKRGGGLCGWRVVDRDFGLRLLQRLRLDNIDDALGFSDGLGLLDLDIDFLFGWKRRFWFVQCVDPNNVGVLLCGLGHLRWPGTAWARGALRTLNDRRWLRIRHIIGLDYLVWYIDWVVRWQRYRVVLDNRLGRRRGRRRRWQWLHGQRWYLIVLGNQGHLWHAHFMIIITPLVIMRINHGYYRFMDLTWEHLNVNTLLKSRFYLFKRDFGHIIKLDIRLIIVNEYINSILGILIDLMNNGFFEHAFSCIFASNYL